MQNQVDYGCLQKATVGSFLSHSRTEFICLGILSRIFANGGDLKSIYLCIVKPHLSGACAAMQTGGGMQ